MSIQYTANLVRWSVVIVIGRMEYLQRLLTCLPLGSAFYFFMLGVEAGPLPIPVNGPSYRFIDRHIE